MKKGEGMLQAQRFLSSLQRTPCWSRQVPEREHDPMGSPSSSKHLEGPVALLRRGAQDAEVSVAGLVTPQDPRWSNLFLKDCALCKGFCNLCEGPHSETEEDCEEEGEAEATLDELIASPIPFPP